MSNQTRPNPESFTVQTFLPTRVASIDVCEVGRKKHHILAFLELDVTQARETIHRLKAETGQAVSFTAWIVKCVSIAASEYPEAHAVYLGRNRRAVFTGVDITVIVEREINGKRVPLPYVVRDTQTKSVQSISDEIRAAQSESMQGQVVLGARRASLAERLYPWLPGLVRRLFWTMLLKSPGRMRATMGTISVTSVGMYGRASAWIVPITVYPLCLGLGTITKKPGVVDDTIRIREVLHTTVMLDHDVIDGAPAARFMSRLAELVESAHGL